MACLAARRAAEAQARSRATGQKRAGRDGEHRPVGDDEYGEIPDANETQRRVRAEGADPEASDAGPAGAEVVQARFLPRSHWRGGNATGIRTSGGYPWDSTKVALIR